MKWLKSGAIAGIISLCLIGLLILLSIAGVFSLNLFFILGLILSLLMLVFWWAFVVLGNKTGNKLIKITSWFFFILGILGIVFAIIGVALISSNPLFNAMTGNAISLPGGFDTSQFGNLEEFNISQFEGMTEEEIMNQLMSQQAVIPEPYQTISSIISLASVVFLILFGVGLIKLRKQFKIAKPTGILYILMYPIMFIGAILVYLETYNMVTYLMLGKEYTPSITFILGLIIILIGAVVALLAFIFSIKLLFQASEKYESRKIKLKRKKKRK